MNLEKRIEKLEQRAERSIIVTVIIYKSRTGKEDWDRHEPEIDRYVEEAREKNPRRILMIEVSENPDGSLDISGE